MAAAGVLPPKTQVVLKKKDIKKQYIIYKKQTLLTLSETQYEEKETPSAYAKECQQIPLAADRSMEASGARLVGAINQNFVKFIAATW